MAEGKLRARKPVPRLSGIYEVSKPNMRSLVPNQQVDDGYRYCLMLNPTEPPVFRNRSRGLLSLYRVRIKSSFDNYYSNDSPWSDENPGRLV
ncbi:unnamed protein product [Ceratitis capitata]|uniref:(Mediterranean fruit fly) hypothetical protein n=1 Tax=Ceratitis capitata TaxID=7213 RepID=A0A811USZ2_CERCA|nr:unnamed protein product [Ceratitis capitata]